MMFDIDLTGDDTDTDTLPTDWDTYFPHSSGPDSMADLWHMVPLGPENSIGLDTQSAGPESSLDKLWDALNNVLNHIHNF